MVKTRVGECKAPDPLVLQREEAVVSQGQVLEYRDGASCNPTQRRRVEIWSC